MPITIWMPAQYVDGFAYDETTGVPVNGETEQSPYDRDTKVCEITQYNGWKESHFCACGEFEATTSQVEPWQVARGYCVDFDGDFFVIEDVSWTIEDGTYICKFGGRDFWRFPDSEIRRDRRVGRPYGTEGALHGSDMMTAIDAFMWWTDTRAGWWRDTRRFSSWATETNTASGIIYTGIATDETEGGTFSERTGGNPSVSEVMSNGAEFRIMANWLSCGLRFRVEYDNYLGLHCVHPEIVDGRDTGIVIKSTDAGVSDFEYSYISRDCVNAVFGQWSAKHLSYFPDAVKYESDSMDVSNVEEYAADGKYLSMSNAVQGDSAGNFAERVGMFAEVYTGLGELPSEIDAVGKGAEMMEWAAGEMSNLFVDPSVEFKFKYSDDGLFRFGVHFGLGDKITIEDVRLGVRSSQRLTTVKTVYDAKRGKRYEFEFSNQRVSQSESIRRRFAELERRTRVDGKTV